MHDEAPEAHSISNVTIITWAVLVGFAIIVIAIAIPNFRHSSIRARVAGVEAEQRNIAIGLESFRVFEGRLPTLPEYYDATKLNDGVSSRFGKIKRTLTSPVSHIAALPGDPFRPRARSHHYLYYTDIVNCWVLGSYGPDREASFFSGPQGGFAKEHAFAYGIPSMTTGDPNTFYGCEPRFWSAPDQGHPLGWGHSKLYAPTNGILSKGDVIKTGP
jgi:hypothetical protein